jgi:hypothetical protein
MPHRQSSTLRLRAAAPNRTAKKSGHAAHPRVACPDHITIWRELNSLQCSRCAALTSAIAPQSLRVRSPLIAAASFLRYLTHTLKGKPQMKIASFAALAAAAFAVSGCATIIEGSSQSIAVATPPTTGATCVLSNDLGSWTVTSPGVANV